MGRKEKFYPSNYSIEKNTSYIRPQEDEDLPYNEYEVPKSDESPANLITVLTTIGLISLSVLIAGGVRYLFYKFLF